MKQKSSTPSLASKLEVTYALIKLTDALVAQGRVLPGIEFMGQERC